MSQLQEEEAHSKSDNPFRPDQAQFHATYARNFTLQSLSLLQLLPVSALSLVYTSIGSTTGLSPWEWKRITEVDRLNRRSKRWWCD